MEKKKNEDLERWYLQNRRNFEYCKEEAVRILESNFKSNQIVYQSISARVKTKESFLKKAMKDKYDMPKEQIKDLVGLRVITYTNQEVREICKAIKKEFIVDSDNSINKADSMEENEVGYLSIHYIVKLKEETANLPENAFIRNEWFEIQIRTLLQHAWAEIEHDRSYKFVGELPKGFKRKFYLIAGVLELMDIEFETLSKAVDDYTLEVKEKTKNYIYDISIDSISLKQYMEDKYGARGDNSENVIKSDIVRELEAFGITTLQHIEDITYDGAALSVAHTYYGILRSIMIIHNAEKYFEKVYTKESFSGISWEVYRLYKSEGVDIDDYVKKYQIKIY